MNLIILTGSNDMFIKDKGLSFAFLNIVKFFIFPSPTLIQCIRCEDLMKKFLVSDLRLILQDNIHPI